MRQSPDSPQPRTPSASSRPRWLLQAAAAVAGLALLIALWAWLRPGAADPRPIPYSELLRALDARSVESLVVRPGLDVRGEWRNPALERPGLDFVVEYPLTTVEDLARRADRAGTRVTLQAPPDRRGIREMASLGLLVLLIGIVGWFFYRHSRSSQHGEIGSESRSTLTFGDVAGVQGAVEELREMVDFLRGPERFAALGARIPKGALLVGPPGTGKTLLARAVAGEAGVPFFSISGSEVTGFLVGMGAQRIKSLFRRARKHGGVIFIDEIDALGGKRGQNRSHNEDDRTLNQLLVEMDGFSPLEGVVVLAATNRADHLDEALKRPGRFDRVISVPTPTAQGREQILRLHVARRQIPLHPEVELARLARLTPGASGAELANLLNEAAITAARHGEASVHWSHVDSARDRILLGKERKGFRALDQERCTVAYHEAGHALIGVLCAPDDGLHKVTIQPRGQAMGVAFFSPSDDRYLYRKSYLEAQIMKGLAGRAAEELIFGTQAITSGAQNDLQQVNGIARRMIYQLGMGTETGLLIHDGEPGSLSPDAHARMDREVRDLLERLYDRTRAVLAEYREALAALAVALLDRDTIDGDEAVEIMREAGLPAPVTTHWHPEAGAAD